MSVKNVDPEMGEVYELDAVNSLTVDQVKNLSLQSVDGWQDLLDDEIEGQNRKGVVDFANLVIETQEPSPEEEKKPVEVAETQVNEEGETTVEHELTAEEVEGESLPELTDEEIETNERIAKHFSQIPYPIPGGKGTPPFPGNKS